MSDILTDSRSFRAFNVNDDFNRTARHEWLDRYLFETIEQTQLLATQWLWTYNNERPHMAIGGIPPRQLLSAA